MCYSNVYVLKEEIDVTVGTIFYNGAFGRGRWLQGLVAVVLWEAAPLIASPLRTFKMDGVLVMRSRAGMSNICVNIRYLVDQIFGDRISGYSMNRIPNIQIQNI